MKKKLILYSIAMVLIIFFFVNTGLASGRRLNATAIKLGYFNPKDAKSGFIIGLNHGYVVDETIDIGFSGDFFYKNYQKETEIATEISEGGVVQTTRRLDVEFTTIVIPLMATANLKIPVSNYTPAFFVVNGGIGWEMMFNSEQNYTKGDDEKQSRFYHGFGYMLNAGMMYQIGSRSALLAEIGYNGCKVSSNHKKEEGAPVWDEVDISGLMLRFGLRIGIL